MTYAERLALWIEQKRAEEAEWQAAQPTNELVAQYLTWVADITDFLAHPTEARALYDAIVRERGK